MSELSPGWAWTTLGEMVEWGSGGTPRRTVARYYGGAIPWAVIGDLNDSVVTTTAGSITTDGLAESSARLVSAGTVLIAMYGSIGKLGIAGVEMATNQAIAFADPRAGLDARFLFWYLRSQRNRLGYAGKGATQKNISQTVLKSWPLPLPPLNEQRRIVAAIEEQLSRLDAADASLVAASARLTPLRERVFEVSQNGAESRPLGELLREPLRNGHSAKADRDGTLRTLTLSAVTQGEFIDANTKLTSADPEKVKNLWLEPGDILVERSNTPELVGTAALFSGPSGWAIFPDLLIRVRVGDSVLPEFVEVVLKSRRARTYFRGAAQGIAGSMPKIDQGVVERLEVPVPPIEEQRRIVADVEARLSALDALRASIERAQQRSRALRAAVLATAFRGELVPQDPADEPADQLLARIRAERAVSERTPGRRRRTVRP